MYAKLKNDLFSLEINLGSLFTLGPYGPGKSTIRTSQRPKIAPLRAKKGSFGPFGGCEET